jgi:hypothetical protein
VFESYCHDNICDAIVAANDEGAACTIARTVDSSLVESEFYGHIFVKELGLAQPDMLSGVLLSTFNPPDEKPLSLKMKLWELTPKDTCLGYDTYVSAIVASETREEATSKWPGSPTDIVYPTYLGRATSEISGVVLANWRAG